MNLNKNLNNQKLKRNGYKHTKFQVESSSKNQIKYTYKVD
jgi:hypothetical protein